MRGCAEYRGGNFTAYDRKGEELCQIIIELNW